MTAQEREALNKFLLDIDCLSELSKWQDDFNIFEILKISRAEIRHSNVLAWLMNPKENHGLGDKVLRGIFQYLAKIPSNINESLELMTMDNYSFSVRREWKNIDILLFSEKAKCVICLENKIDSKENKGNDDKDGQLKKYQKIIEKDFSKYNKKYFIFLTPSGEAPSDTENWTIMDYNEVLDIVVNARETSDLSSESAMLIDNYISLLRRKIVEDRKLIDICNKIYKKHKEALDLIFENKIDPVVEVCENWISSKGFKKIKVNNTVVAFATDNMEAIFPTDDSRTDSAWGNGRLYCFEIRPNRKDLKIQIGLVLDLRIKDNKNKEDFINKTNQPKGETHFRVLSETFEYDYEERFSENEWSDAFNEAWANLQDNIYKICKNAGIEYTKA